MSRKLVIGKVNKQNFSDFLYLIDKLAEYEKLEPPNKEVKKRLMKDGIGKNPKYEAFLGKLNGKPISYVTYYMTYSSFLGLPTLFLEDFFVLEKHRKKGIGQKMFDFCVEKAKEKGCGRIELCVLNWNIPAIKFYKKNKAMKLDWTFFRFTKGQIDNYTPKN